MILLIDNHDSFVWNLVQGIGALNPHLQIGRDLRVARNDELTPADIETLAPGNRPPSHIIISPGPCGPEQAGISTDVIRRFAGRIPILGVCLGHQCIGAAHNMDVVRHQPVHGKTSLIHHDNRGIFTGLPSPFTAMRYHSLIVLAPPTTESPPVHSSSDSDTWEVSAWTEDTDPAGNARRIVMGLRRNWADPAKAPLEGVQFHPESFLTEGGAHILSRFLNCSSAARLQPATLSTR